MKMSSENLDLQHECKFDWGHDVIVKLQKNEIITLKNKIILSKEDKNNGYFFAANCPSPENIEAQNIYFQEKWQKPRVWITGRGKNPLDAEKSAYEKFLKCKICTHDFLQQSDSILIGDAVCKICGLFISEYFMQEDIKKAKYLSLSYHHNEILFDDVTVANHLHSMTTEMIYDINLRDNEKIDLMCAGWLHHSHGNLSSNDKVEQILKYFYLDHKQQYESIILQYYDIVDTIRILLNKPKHKDFLKKTVILGKELLQELENRNLPNSTFLQSWLMMA